VLPTDLVVQAGPKADFKRLFGVSWDAAVERGLVCNARDAAASTSSSSAAAFTWHAFVVTSLDAAAVVATTWRRRTCSS